MSKTIKLIVGSTRSGRAGKPIADWLVSVAKTEGYNVELLDLQEVNLPMFAAPVSPMYMPVDTPEAKAWAGQIASADGLVFLTSEYNRSIPASLKNAIDFLYAEWNEKPASIVSYGYIDGGKSATSHLKDILNWVKVGLVEPEVSVQFGQDTFDESGQFVDIDGLLGSAKEDFLAQLKALSQ